MSRKHLTIIETFQKLGMVLLIPRMRGLYITQTHCHCSPNSHCSPNHLLLVLSATTLLLLKPIVLSLVLTPRLLKGYQSSTSSANVLLPQVASANVLSPQVAFTHNPLLEQ